VTQVQAQLVSSAGQLLGPPIGVGYANLYAEDDASVDMAASGRFVVAWTSTFSATDTDVMAEKFDGSGNAVGGPFYVASSSAADEFDASAGMDSNGNITVVYQWGGPGNVYSVDARFYSF